MTNERQPANTTSEFETVVRCIDAQSGELRSADFEQRAEENPYICIIRINGREHVGRACSPYWKVATNLSGWRMAWRVLKRGWRIEIQMTHDDRATQEPR